MNTSSNLAIIGLGNIGQAVAANFSKSAFPFIAADRDLEKEKNFQQNGGHL